MQDIKNILLMIRGAPGASLTGCCSNFIAGGVKSTWVPSGAHLCQAEFPSLSGNKIGKDEKNYRSPMTERSKEIAFACGSTPK